MHPKRKQNPQAQRPTVQAKELDAIIKTVWGLGWWARRCGTGHVMCYHPTDMKEKVLVNNTVSNPHLVRAVKRSFAAWGSRYNVRSADGRRMNSEHYEISVELTAAALSEVEIEDALVRLVDLLTNSAPALALGPTGAIHGTTIELLFTVEANDTTDLYSKLAKVARILRDSGDVEFASSSARRELALA